MKNKIKRITSIVLCMVLCLSVFAVSNLNNEGESEKDAPISISFVGYEGMIQARAGEPTPYTGSSLWVSVASTDNSDNKKYNCSDAEWKATNGVFSPTSTVYYTGTSGDQTLWAFSSDVTEWSLPASYEDGLSDFDLLYAKTTLTSATVQNLEMQHLLSKITVKISGFGNELSSPSVDEVALIDLLSKVAIDRTEVDAPIMAATDATTDAGTVMYGSDATTFEALVCPSSQTAVGIGVSVTVDGVDKYFSTTANFADGLKSGYHYVVNLQVANDKITIGTVTVEDWNDGGTIDAPTATEPEASYSISGTTATITVPEYASAASVQAAAKAVAEDFSVTTVTVNGTLSDAQQTALATGLNGYSGTLILDNMSSDDVTVDALKNMTVVYNGYVLDSTTNTYQVYTANGLYAWATETGTDATANLKLMADITLPNKDADGNEITVTDGKPSGSNWTPVGMSTSYKGSIDGNGKTITGLRIYSESINIGFVSQLGENGNIKNLHLDDVAVYSENQIVGGVVGKVWQTAGDISGCSVRGSVMSYRTLVGGIVGNNESGSGIITDCENHATVTGSSYVGGIVGEMNRNSVTNCTNTGTVTAVNKQAGGIAGCVNPYNDYTPLISGCFNSGKVTSMNETYKENGGIVGEISTSGWTVIACVNTGEVENGAGIVGNNGGAVIACYTTQNSVVVTNQAGYDPYIYEGSIMGTYYLGGDDAFEGTNGVSDLNTDEVVKTMNGAISAWTDSDGNACAYMWQIGTTYPKLVANTAN